ncbi:unnamed protein product [Cyprideis torosa]|uniref:Uncharacterized protein n=1 Tax=Cyprideis torosa TaxID=163714 RepID=A0A7R8WK79_9CRUS|nr:unnamed protein product [Cyprideis torosa]CAG0902848.1 unnamed protein product [Cyprideis torosa]
MNESLALSAATCRRVRVRDLQATDQQRNTDQSGLTELNLLVLRPFSHILLNAKQMRIYKVVINESFDVGFENFDPLMKIGDREHPEDGPAGRRGRGLRGEVMVPLPPSLTAEMHSGHSIRVEVEFSLENPRGGIQFVLPEEEGSLEEGVRADIFTQESARLWFPCLDAYSEPCTWKLEFTVDESMTAVSCGELLETTCDARHSTAGGGPNRGTGLRNERG